MTIARYADADRPQWDAFAATARNRHFFFDRNYMDYHRDRFTDCSLMARDDKGRLVALLPATADGDAVVSHGGLTFGGFLVNRKMTAVAMLDVFAAARAALRGMGFRRLIYKAMPHIYHRCPCEEDLYALFVNKARLVRRDLSAAIYLPERYPYAKLRQRKIREGRNVGLKLTRSRDFAAFHAISDAVLSKYHGAHPVHSVAEMELLAGRFPDNLKLYAAELHGEMVAGALLFENGAVAHVQYWANSDRGRTCGALDCLADYLIGTVCADKTWFDIGISNEPDTHELNRGLIAQKEGFGARAIAQDFYELELQ